jgi:hypothetical protein
MLNGKVESFVKMGNRRGWLMKKIFKISSMMRSILIVFWVSGVVLLASSCATVSTGPLAPGELRLLGLEVEGGGNVTPGIHYAVKVIFEADGKPEIKNACLSWSGEGPYCFKVKEIYYGLPGTFRIWPRTNNPGSYRLECYVEYIRDGKTQRTNVVGSQITIR